MELSKQMVIQDRTRFYRAKRPDGKDIYAPGVNLVDLRAGRVRESAADYNDQIACGEDVISRIIYSQQGKGDGLGRLQDRL